MTRNVRVNFTVENISDVADESDPQGAEDYREIAKFLNKNNKERWEKGKIDTMLRKILKDAALTGDMGAHVYFDPTINTGQTSGLEVVTDKDENPILDETGESLTKPVPIMGEFVTEKIDDCNIMLGNPNDSRINDNGRPFQPYVIVIGRDVVKNLRKEAKLYKKKTDLEAGNGLSDDEIDALIVPDREYEEQAGDRGKNELENSTSEYGKAQYIIKYWVEDGKIYFSKSVRGCYIRKGVETALTIYPVAFGNWDTIPNSYHGQAVMTGLVNNQIQIDRSMCQIFKYIQDMALPKYLVNKAYLPNGISNRVNEQILYEGMDNIQASNVVSTIPPGQMANNLIDFIVFAIQQTLNLIGVLTRSLEAQNPKTRRH
jgi:hypothetical protein